MPAVSERMGGMLTCVLRVGVRKRPTLPRGKRIKKDTEVGKCGRSCGNTVGKYIQFGGQVVTVVMASTTEHLLYARLSATFFTYDTSLDLYYNPAGKTRENRDSKKFSKCQRQNSRSSDSEAQAHDSYTILVPRVMQCHRSQAEECGFDSVGDDQSSGR